MRFANGLKPGNRTKYGTVIAVQKQLNGKVQLTLSGRNDNVILSKYTLVRTIFWS
jgi:hypothetical protein